MADFPTDDLGYIRSLDGIAVGDEFLVREGRWDTRLARVTCSKVTPKQCEIGGHKYRIADARGLGGDTYGPVPSLMAFDEAVFCEDQERQALREMRNRLNCVRWGEIGDDAIRAVAGIVWPANDDGEQPFSTEPSMPTTSTTIAGQPLNYGRDDDREYHDYLTRLQARFLANVGGGPLFETNANVNAAHTLYHIYLDNVPDRQHHTCHACRRFLESYGGLVTIEPETGRTASAIWDESDAPEYYRPAIASVARAVRKAQVTGVFLSADPVWGTPVTPSPKTGIVWHHYAVTPPESMVYHERLNVRLMVVESIQDIPSVGRNVVIVASVDGDLYFRIFDYLGKMVMDKTEADASRWAPALKDRLADMFPPKVLTPALKAGILVPITTALGYRDTGSLLTAEQAAAEKAEDFKNIRRAIAEFSPSHVGEAMRLLQSETLYRSEKVIGPARWLDQLHAAIATVKGTARENVIWRAIATAPAGFCHPRSSMVGTLLDDISGGMDFAVASRRFAAKMHPLQYQRPQAAPSAGNIAEAEKIAEKLGIARSLERRFARLDEVEAIWRPKPASHDPKSSNGVFGHLKPKGTTPAVSPIVTPPITMTWEKFARTVLPTSEAIEYMVTGGYANYVTLTTAVHADSPPIIQWDAEDARNPVAWYLYTHGSPARQYGLSKGWCKVTAVTLKPSLWNNPERFAHQGEGVFFLLDGAKDTEMQGNALFPEILKSDLHAVRSTIEAYNRKAVLHGKDEASATGIGLQKGGTWNEVFRVTTGGATQEYRLDRWD